MKGFFVLFCFLSVLLWTDYYITQQPNRQKGVGTKRTTETKVYTKREKTRNGVDVGW